MSSRPASERYEVDVKPVRGPLNILGLLAHLAAVPLFWTGATDWAPCHARLLDRDRWAYVVKDFAWSPVDAATFVQRVQRDIDCMTVEEFRAEWNLP